MLSTGTLTLLLLLAGPCRATAAPEAAPTRPRADRAWAAVGGRACAWTPPPTGRYDLDLARDAEDEEEESEVEDGDECHDGWFGPVPSAIALGDRIARPHPHERPGARPCAPRSPPSRA